MPSIPPAKEATEQDNWRLIGAPQTSREECSGAAERITQLLSDDSLEKVADLRDYERVTLCDCRRLASVEAQSCTQRGNYSNKEEAARVAHF